jgi:signal transduction histidine kinase
MRVLPRSLFGRLVLVLVAGLLAAQLASTVINLRERDQLLYRAGGMRLAQQIADIVRLFESLPDAERRQIASVFSSPTLAVSLDKAPLAARADAGEADFPLSMFSTMLRLALGEDASITVERVPSGVSFGPPGPPGMMGWPHRMGADGARGRGAAAAAFTVQVGLRDGTFATFESGLSPEVTATPLRLALTLVVLVGTVVVLSLVAVRWITAPLIVLANAAEALGKDIERPPMPETGPTEVRRAAKAFNAMQQKLARLIGERTRVLIAISHDLKTPITRMRLRSELLDDATLREKFDRDLAEMELMVTQALEFMRDASRSEPPQRVDLMALLESLQADYHDTGQCVDVEGRVAAPLMARPVALRRCLTNLVDNAVRYGERASIAVVDDAQGITLRVRDRGPGIAEQDLEQVFEPFFRGEASRNRATGGSGLGLGIARNIARAHGGDLTLRNLPECGLEATLTLPRA